MLSSLDGDLTSYRALLERLSRRLRAYYKGKLSGIGKGAAEAEDLVQEAVLAINIRLHTYDLAGPISPWVNAVARYKLIDFPRRSRRSLADVPIDEADQIMAHDDNVDAESTYDVRRILQRLPKNMRCAIEAVKLDGHSIAEAAAMWCWGSRRRAPQAHSAYRSGGHDRCRDRSSRSDLSGLAISLLFGLVSSILTVLVIPAIYIALREPHRNYHPASKEVSNGKELFRTHQAHFR